MRVPTTALALAMLLAGPAAAQQMEDAHNNLFADHSASGSNGAHRLGARVGDAPTAQAPQPTTTFSQPPSSGIRVYHPRPLNDVAKDWAKAHPNDLPNRRKPDPQ